MTALLSLTAPLPDGTARPEGTFSTVWEPRDPGLAFWGRGIAARIIVDAAARAGSGACARVGGDDADGCVAGAVRTRDAGSRLACATAVVAAGERLFDAIDDVREPGAEDAPRPLLVGGLAFEPSSTGWWPGPWTAFGDGSFVLPRWLVLARDGRRWARLTVPASVGVAAAHVRLQAFSRRLARAEADEPGPAIAARSFDRTTPDEWRALVTDGLDRLARHEVDKLVAARCSLVRSERPIPPAVVLARLRAAARPGEGTLFALRRGRATFLGLSPERLVAREGARVRTEALAGTTPGIGARAATALGSSGKDLHEHAVVVRSVRAILAPLCRELVVAAAPVTRRWPGLRHLWTPFEGTLQAPRHVLELALRLHPTPAVAGAPADRALAWIASREPVPRGWYAGPVGWFDAAGDGELAVAIRSAVVAGSRAWIWSGAGLVAASDADREWAETSVKQRLMLRALGVPA